MAQTGEPSAGPFRNIALSLSGGGTRAVGYHLGTLDYLHRCGLLEQVGILSTVSGGTLVGASYVLSVEENISFQDLFFDFFEFFPKINMVEGLLEIINRKNLPVTGGNRNLATAFAELYHEAFFSHYFSDPYFGSIGRGEPREHLQDVIFNATEFKTGIAFRFQKSRNACKVGNGNVWIDPVQADEMRIADVVSASSCIPGGFEPFRFPAEFHWPSHYCRGAKRGTPFEKVRLQTTPEGSVEDEIALMDGGVYDNQGITSVLLAVSRRRDDVENRFEADEDQDSQSWANWAHELLSNYSAVDLFIVSDTPLLRDPLYAPDGQKIAGGKPRASWLGRRTLGDINRYAWIVAMTLVASAMASFLRLVQTGQVSELRRHLVEGVGGYLPLVYEAMATLIPLAVAGLLGVVLLSLRAKIVRMTKTMGHKLPAFKHPPWHYLKGLHISDLLGMVRLRAGSMMALSADIYTHRIRQLGYSLLFSHRELVPTLLANEIHAIKREGNLTATFSGQCENVSEEVRAIVDLCSGMATKGWFDPVSPDTLQQGVSFRLDDTKLTRMAKRDNGDQRGDLDVLTACGQVTTCYNIIRYVQQKLDGGLADGGDPATDSLRSLLDRARKDWNRLQATPFMFVDERLQAGRSPQHAKMIADNIARACASTLPGAVAPAQR